MNGEHKNGEQPQQPPPVTAEQFSALLNQLVGAALTGGQVTFGDVVSTLEFAKSDVIEMARQQANQPPPEPLIVPARDVRPPLV